MHINTLKQNLDDVTGRMHEAARRGRGTSDDVRLLPVTKTVDVDTMLQLAELGCRHFGENRVGAALDKRAALPDELSLEMIGHLQRNKVRKALPTFTCYHGVDSPRLARELSKQADKMDLPAPPVMLEVNVSGEDAKYGFTPQSVREVLPELADLEHIRIVGLMTMAPFGADEVVLHEVFGGLRRLAQELAAMELAGVSMDELSMGMTQDFEIAVEEGATVIRVGSALFRE